MPSLEDVRIRVAVFVHAVGLLLNSVPSLQRLPVVVEAVELLRLRAQSFVNLRKLPSKVSSARAW